MSTPSPTSGQPLVARFDRFSSRFPDRVRTDSDVTPVLRRRNLAPTMLASPRGRSPSRPGAAPRWPRPRGVRRQTWSGRSRRRRRHRDPRRRRERGRRDLQSSRGRRRRPAAAQRRRQAQRAPEADAARSLRSDGSHGSHGSTRASAPDQAPQEERDLAVSRLVFIALVAAASASIACGPAPLPRPLPGGLPPEYEAPRASNPDPNALENRPGKPVVTGPQAPAPTGTNPTTPAPGPPVAPPPQLPR